MNMTVTRRPNQGTRRRRDIEAPVHEEMAPHRLEAVWAARSRPLDMSPAAVRLREARRNLAAAFGYAAY